MGPCPDGSRRDMNCKCPEKTQESCDVIYGPCPVNSFRGKSMSCECIPNPTTSQPETTAPESSCAFKACEQGYYWSPEPVCKCLLFCDYIMICTAGQTWDLNKCRCVTDPKYTTRNTQGTTKTSRSTTKTTRRPKKTTRRTTKTTRRPKKNTRRTTKTTRRTTKTTQRTTKTTRRPMMSI